MACFLIPTTEAIVSTVVTKIVEKNEQKNSNKYNFSKKIKWLSNMLWGGSSLLAFEHIWHGEVTPWFPFLTAMNNAVDTTNMLHEMSTIGVSMSLVVTAVWIVMVLVSGSLEKKSKEISIEMD